MSIKSASEAAVSTFRSFSGLIENVAISEVLRLIARRRLTGQLEVQRRDAEAMLVSREGRIVRAASTSVRETIGSLLFCRGLVTEDDLVRALHVQQTSPQLKLGEVLVRMGKMTPGQLDEIVGLQIEKVVAEILQWDGGFFQFKRAPAEEEADFAEGDFVAARGVDVNQILGGAASRLASPEPTTPQIADLADFDIVFPPPPGSEAAVEPSGVEELLAPFGDAATPVLRGENVAMLMRCAANTTARGVLWAIRGRSASVVAHFGLGDPAVTKHLALVDLPLQGSEVVATAVEHRRPYRGPIQPSTNTALLRHVGGPTPGEVLVLPMVVHGSVAMVFYGDDAARSGGIGATRALEFLILETGLEMEKADVEERMRQLRAAQGR